MKVLLIVLLLATTLCSYSQKMDPEKYGVSNESLPNGIEIGTVVDFDAISASGEEISLSTYFEEGPVVVIFYRGFWCPVCNRYLKNFADSLHLITSQGATVLAVTPETYVNVEKTKKKTKLPIEIISDPNEQIMKKFGVNFKVTEAYQKKIKTFLRTDIAETNGKEEAVLPVPATYIINQKGVVVWKQFDVNYKRRASIKDILENLPESK